MKGSRSEVLYVGKAKNLRSRVRSYFQKLSEMHGKTAHLVKNIHDIEYLPTGSEIEALLLENNLIKKWKPKYNIRMRDDKTYPYIKLDRRHPYPRAYVARKQLKGDGNAYFGPFPNGAVMRQSLEAASKLFLLRDCRDHEFANRSRPCLSYEIGQCSAPCVKYVSAEDYQKQCENYLRFLRGETDEILAAWEREMESAAEALEFEKAARLRDRIRAFQENTDQQAQRIVNTQDMSDRDIWAFWPPLSQVVTAEFSQLSITVLQIRGGKWVGRSQRSADLADVLAGDSDSLIENLLLQYYAKQALVEEILLPPDTAVTGLPDLAVALLTVSQKAGLEVIEEGREARPPALRLSSDHEEWARLFELAEQNAKTYFEEAESLRERKEDALAGIQRMLGLPVRPRRIECIDVSNFQGEANVASAVVFTDGKPDKAQYRHYKIRGVEGQNDFASMKEVMSRRYGKPDSPCPDLLVIDGGRGQLSAVNDILMSLSCDFTVVGLAKARTESDFTNEEVKASEERIFVTGQKNPLKIRNMEALKVLTQLRDEAHRFAITFHRKKRSEARGI